MNNKKTKPLFVGAILALSACVCVLFSGAVPAAAQQSEALTVMVDVYSGRPNPTFTVSGQDEINRLRENVNKMPEASITRAEDDAFGRLGYRGIVITPAGNAGGLPESIRALNGKVKITDASRSDQPGYYQDTQG